MNQTNEHNLTLKNKKHFKLCKIENEKKNCVSVNRK